jgi:glycosyltransferase involved in cell wall biosynthesis
VKLHLAIVGPGILPIPPFGWGAVESVIWSQTRSLQKRGIKVSIINESKNSRIIRELKNLNPDFTIFHYDELIDTAIEFSGKKAIVSHYGYLDQINKHGRYSKIFEKFITSNIPIFCLSSSILETYKSSGADLKNLHFVPNGVDSSQYNFLEQPLRHHRAIYLAKIDFRKRQYLFQDINFVDFAGNIVDKHFINFTNYLGEWSRNDVYKKLTHYPTLVLLSDGEAHPLVVMEAMASGCGLVLSEYASANLKRNLPFVDIIPERLITDKEFVSKIILDNTRKSVHLRSLIRKEAAQFDWEYISKNFLLKAIKKSIDND